jgi:hypothetical protein
MTKIAHAPTLSNGYGMELNQFVFGEADADSAVSAWPL